MSIQLPPDVEASIIRRVQRGQFPDEVQVVREALQLLDERERQLDALRNNIRIGLNELERGEGAEWTPELLDRLNREADEMFHRGELPDPDVCP